MGVIKDLLTKIIKRILHIEKEVHPIIQYPTDSSLLKGKIILITGGTGGIGFEVARLAIKSGAKVILAGTNEDKLSKLTNSLGTFAVGVKVNLANISELKKDIDNAINSFNEHRIDVLVNSAGVHGNWDFFNPLEEEFDKVMDVNLKGTFFVTNYIANFMIKNKIEGHILNISSSSALRPAWTPYQISKWAIDGMTKGFADRLLPYGIVVNGLAPGPTATPMVKDDGKNDIYYKNQPSHRYLMPEEVANLAIFMISNSGDMIVGHTVYITGGSGTISYHR